MPAWFAGAENETVAVTVKTGAEVVSNAFDVKMLPFILDEKKFLK